jgi:nucleoside-diphosphate-sugar epimerase
MVFVTGGTGLVGSYLIKTLLDAGTPVRALRRRPHDGDVLSGDGDRRVEWVEGDILDIESLEEGMRGVRQVYHCAALVSFNPRQAARLFKVNVEGTANVVNAALLNGVQKLAHVSSVASLGRNPAGSPTDESMNWEEETNKSIYAKSKYAGEMEVWRGMAEGLETIIVNPSTILGAGDWKRGSAKLFKSVYDEFPWYTEGVNGFVDVRDVADALIRLMDSPIHSRRFILSSENWSYQRLFNEIADQFGKRNPYKKVSPFLAEVIWRLEKIKGLLSGKDPLLTKETARTAQAISLFDNRKVQEALPGFRFTPLEEAVRYHCTLFKANYSL